MNACDNYYETLCLIIQLHITYEFLLMGIHGMFILFYEYLWLSHKCSESLLWFVRGLGNLIINWFINFVV